MAEYRVFEVKELPKFPKSEEARGLLQKLAAATAKVLVRRKWRVGSLREFYPQNDSLLGLNENRGNTIRIRLRSSKDQNQFLPWTDLLGTMVHELTHNEVSSHSAEFYQLMDKVYDEVEADESGSSRGFDRVGGPPPDNPLAFEGKGTKLGGSAVPGSAKNRAAEAAIRRQLINGGGTGGVLGGGSAPLSAEEVRRLRVSAAERRQTDQGSCSIDKKDLIGSSPQGRAAKPNHSFPSSSSSSSSTAAVVSRRSPATMWRCGVCVEENLSLDGNCVFCGSLRGTDFISSEEPVRACGCCQPGVGFCQSTSALGKRKGAASDERKSGRSRTADAVVVDLTSDAWQCSRCTFVNDSGLSSGLGIRICSVCQEVQS